MGSNGAHGGGQGRPSARVARAGGASAPLTASAAGGHGHGNGAAGRQEAERLAHRPGPKASNGIPMASSPSSPPSPSQPPVDFAAEYQKAYRVLWVVAAGVLGRSAGAEDVVQEAALLGLKKLEQFQPGTHFAAWMAQMVRYVALNQLRRQTRNTAASFDETHVRARALANGRGPGDDAGGDDSACALRLGRRGEVPADQRSFDDELMAALGTLSDVARACLLLRTLEGTDYEEIGRILDIPQGTAMSHVHRSRMRLREQLLAGRRQQAKGQDGRS